MLGAQVKTGTFHYRIGRRSAADFLALLQELVTAFPHAPAVVVLCDNESIHRARTVRAFVSAHPGCAPVVRRKLQPARRLWAPLKAFVANTATTWPGHRRQVHAYFRPRSPDQHLTTAAPWTSPWFPNSYRQKFWSAAETRPDSAPAAPVPVGAALAVQATRGSRPRPASAGDIDSHHAGGRCSTGCSALCSECGKVPSTDGSLHGAMWVTLALPPVGSR
ncbi:hypothetical protein GCM10010145_61550 [Streptomyces ruber]|uniref:Tc1-like transposase DDE domain-containing protein n=2 Tax=Streptomyces TaxID=1883 RepID=A0A918BQP2_9ACTN|nr:hypothetical protein GCM10010145_61550 [Streptomyces ruber]